MKRKWLAVGIILLFVGVTIAPTINFNIVKASQQSVIKEKINQRELLFQTIVDIANNKEIQRIILKSHMMNGKFLDPYVKLTTPITKQQLRQMYIIGLILSKVISKSRIQSMVQQYQLINAEIPQEINAVIEKDATLKGEITQLRYSDCDCENDNTTEWRFPVICLLLYPIVICVLMICGLFLGGFSLGILWGIGLILQCFWWNPRAG
jgi:hypothetical protein